MVKSGGEYIYVFMSVSLHEKAVFQSVTQAARKKTYDFAL